MTRSWPATCSICGKRVRKTDSHAGAPGSPQPVRHLDCALAPQRHVLDPKQHQFWGTPYPGILNAGKP